MNLPSPLPALRPALAATALVALGGCATGPDADPRDPLEPFNRQVQRFNDAADEAVFKPVATAYVKVTPSPVRTGVNNFFSNLGDLWSAVNAGLQLRPRESGENLMRFGVNTVLGFGGLLDIASEAGIPRSRIDFGQTMGRWGVPSGPYVVWPLLGPSTARDSVGMVADAAGDPVAYVDHVPTRNSLYALRIVDTRAQLLRASNLLDDAALDKYSFTRDFYLSRRQTQINDMIDKGIGLGNGN
ncbi:MAG: VacJ family lipoprotein [Hydrogenophaga sp.]|uniref:VacJ family lipoprotein n=1 Tax=Hydrogenophaga crocea TaxID=2716225 RepID=A0A6G8IN28_9BURK|nr:MULTISPECIES: VacJ family lipoprotein [Hydrogenophaga]MBL0943162.1 VacJ family lipoprotein [Hydrogenophaga sp.]QIM54436.1 VacJ family lipoprotein [Hydrogenophaga crocea]